MHIYDISHEFRFSTVPIIIIIVIMMMMVMMMMMMISIIIIIIIIITIMNTLWLVLQKIPACFSTTEKGHCGFGAATARRIW